MDFFLIIFLAASVQSKPTQQNKQQQCNRLKIGDRLYEREVLWANIGRPYNLNVHKTTNTLFFSYSILDTYSDVDFQLGYYNIDTKGYQTIAGIRGGCSVAIDSITDDIYLGGSDGIYKFNMLTNIADYYSEKGKNIWSLFHRNHLFYISYPDQKLHLQIDGKFAKVREFENFKVDNFFVTSTNEMYFANESGLFKYDTESMTPVVVNELITVRQIVEDNESNLYVCTNFGIYIDVKYNGFKKIVDHKNIFGLAFDKDNDMIISDENSVIKLKQSTYSCNNTNFHW